MVSYLAALTKSNAQQLRLDMYSLKVCKFAHRLHIKVNTDALASLGPWPETIPKTYLEHYRQAFHYPTLASRESPALFNKWQKHHLVVRMGSWPTSSNEEITWYQSRKNTDLRRWQAVGIAKTLELCFFMKNGGGNQAPLVATVCFWDTSSNTFNFRFGR